MNTTGEFPPGWLPQSIGDLAFGRDLDQFPDLLMPVVDRLLEGPIRTVATSLSAAAPDIDGDAMATVLIGSLVNCGSAAAVCTGMAALALGSDGRGSVRYPAGMTGLVGLNHNVTG